MYIPEIVVFVLGAIIFIKMNIEALKQSKEFDLRTMRCVSIDIIVVAFILIEIIVNTAQFAKDYIFRSTRHKYMRVFASFKMN